MTVGGGYPVAMEMEDARVFAACYWQRDDADVPWHGGRAFIGGVHFST